MRICKRCVMDTTDPDIIFDSKGICNNCTNAIKKLQEFKFESESDRIEKQNSIVNEIKTSKHKAKYDCIIGLSGGVDSSYLAYYVVEELGLKPLAVHVDNGWNTELAVMNIENIVKKLSIDLHTHVIDWEEFKALQLAFLKASVLDIELLTDHAIAVVIKKVAKKYGIKFFINGHNFQAESIMPNGWLYTYKHDSLNIKDIYRMYGSGRKIKTFPFLNFLQYLSFGKNKMRLIPLLHYVDYNKDKALAVLEKELSWRNYGGKHHESFFTRFYQTYILPEKFNIDKRKAHLSSLICSGQISRDEAFAELSQPLVSKEELQADKEYFLKKMGLTQEAFETIMKLPVKSHWSYRSFAKYKRVLRILLQKFRIISE